MVYAKWKFHWDSFFLSDQTVQIDRLTYGFPFPTCQKVPFHMSPIPLLLKIYKI